MHHFTSHAYQTLPGSDETKRIWGFAVPQEAFKYDYLLHSLLAFSSNHLAYINPSRATYFRMAAAAHQSAALKSLRQAIMDIGPMNCHAIFASATLAVMNAFAAAREYNPDVLVEIIRLVRGIDIVVMNLAHLLLSGPFASIIKPAMNLPKTPSLLYTFLLEIHALRCSASANPSESSPAIVKAIELLRIALQCSIQVCPHPALRALMTWPITLDTDFVETLRNRHHPYIRALLKQYCQLLEYSSVEYWFLSEWKGISQKL